jgi:predicted amidohydrolase
MSEIISNTASFFAGFLQFDVQSGAIEKNLSQVSKGLAEIADSHRQISPGIIVLPELWATGFAYEKLPALAGTIPEVLEKLQKLSAEYQVIIAGSLPEYSDNSYFNTLFITGTEGTVGTFRKQRLFSPMAEDTFFAPGTCSSPVHTSFGPVAGLVCYDLRYPELLRDQTALGANLLVVPAQWPAARINHWRILVQARAIENQMFVVAANRCGKTADTTFGGHSMIVGPDGAILLEAGDGMEYRGTMLDHAMVLSARSLFSTLPKK